MGAYLRPHRLEEALTALARPHTVLGRRHRLLPGAGRPGDRRGRARYRRHRRPARHRSRRRGLAAGRHHDLERADRGRPAAAVRWPEAGGARSRRPADPERRHARRQSLQRLAGGRRRALPAGPRRRGRDRRPGRQPAPAAAPVHHRRAPHRAARRASCWSRSMCRGPSARRAAPSSSSARGAIW